MTIPTGTLPAPSDRSLLRLAGGFYLVIIVCGLWSELAVRQPILSAGDAAAVDAAIRSGASALRRSLAADLVMALSDVALAVLLFAIFQPVDRLIAGMAMTFRLVQAAIIGAGLMVQYAALQIATATALPAGAAATSLELHGMGYDFGLAFFGVNCLLTGWLVIKSPLFARWLGVLIGAAGAVYLTGTALRLLAPGLAEPFAAAYVVPMVAELTFCLWLLAGGRGREKT